MSFHGNVRHQYVWKINYRKKSPKTTKYED